MDIWDLTKLVFRRWYVFVPLLVTSVAMVLMAGASVKPDYSALGHVQLIPATATANEARLAGRVPNPWPDLGFPALGTAVNLKVTQDEALLNDLVAQGLTENFSIAMEWNTTYFTIEAVGDTPQQAIGTVQRLMRVVADEVVAQQSQFRVAPEDMITTLALDRGDKVTVVTSTRTRVVVVIAGIGTIFSVAGTIAVDALIRRRKSQREFEASEEMLGARVPGVQSARRGRWHQTAPPRTASGARMVPEPGSTEVVPVRWPEPVSPGPGSTAAPGGGRDALVGHGAIETAPARSAPDLIPPDGDDGDAVLVDQTLILPLSVPSRPASNDPK